MKSPGKRLLVLPAAGLVLAGCQPFHAGAAATVGSERISTSQVRDVVSRGLAVVPAGKQVDQTTLERTTLTQLVQLQVLRAIASPAKITVNQQDIDAAINSVATQGRAQLDQQAAAAGVAPGDVPLYFENGVLEQKLLGAVPQQSLQALFDAHKSAFEQVHVAHILVSSQALAEKILAQVTAKPSSFAALARKYSIDKTSAVKGGDLGFAKRGDYVKAFEDAAFGGTDGTIVGPVKTQFGYHIIKIIQHRNTLASLDAQSLALLRAQVLAGEFSATEKRLGVHVNPRFGTWNPAVDLQNQQFGVVQAATTGDLSTPVSPTPADSVPAQGSGTSQ